MKVIKHVRIKHFYIMKTTSYDEIKIHNRKIRKMELNSKFKGYSEVLNFNKGKEVKIKVKKPMTEKQRQLLIRLIIAAISFVLGLTGHDSEIVDKVIEFVESLV